MLEYCTPRSDARRSLHTLAAPCRADYFRVSCAAHARSLMPATKIHKPSTRVSFGLPDPLSFQVGSPVMVARRSGTNTRQGKRQGQAAKQPDPPSWECNARITKLKAQEGKGEPDARTCVLDTVDGQAQPGQYGCRHCCLGCGSARPSGCQAVLRLAAFAQSRWLLVRSGRRRGLDNRRAPCRPWPGRAREPPPRAGWSTVHCDMAELLFGDLPGSRNSVLPARSMHDRCTGPCVALAAMPSRRLEYGCCLARPIGLADGGGVDRPCPR